MVVPCHALLCPLMGSDMGWRCGWCKSALSVSAGYSSTLFSGHFRHIRTGMAQDSSEPTPMSATDRLTVRERDALRLYNDLNSAKAVAQKLNVSHHTVYQRLGSAKDKLGVPSYMAAARQFVESERVTEPESFAYEQFGVVPDRFSASPSDASEVPWPFPTPGRPENDLSFGGKLIAVFGLAMLMMATAALYFIAFGVFSSALRLS
ncbi:MAG: helix-turn-helix transcriptional regulator [Sphingomonadales bacterium]|nr:MAG: helix-turn-helix transcriptional regulator [Sphingomonadales bacterium]